MERPTGIRTQRVRRLLACRNLDFSQFFFFALVRLPPEAYYSELHRAATAGSSYRRCFLA